MHFDIYQNSLIENHKVKVENLLYKLNGMYWNADLESE